MNLQLIQEAHEELGYVSGGLRSLGHLLQISAQSADQVDLDGVGKLLMTVSSSVNMHYQAMHVGLYGVPPEPSP